MPLRIENYVQAIVVRIDRAPLSTLAAPLAGILFEGVVARTHGSGDPLKYPSGPEYRDGTGLDSIVKQLVGLKVVASPDAATGHPDDLLKYGAEARVIGKIIAARRDDNEAVATIMITDEDTLDEIRRDGVKSLSLGYETQLDDARRQILISLDHLSVVTKGRCEGLGGTCALRVDAISQEPEETTMAEVPKIEIEVVVTDHTDGHQDAKLTAAARHNIPGHLFADPAHKGFPIEDAAHVRDAMARFEEAHFASPATKRSVFHRIIARAHELGVDPSGFQKKHEGNMDHLPGECGCKKLADPGIVSHIPGSMADSSELQKQLDDAKAELETTKKKLDSAEIANREAVKDAKSFEARIAEADAKVATAEAAALAAKTAAETAVTAAKAQAKLDAAETIKSHTRETIEVLKAADDVLGKTDKDGKRLDHLSKTDKDGKPVEVEVAQRILELKTEIARRVDGDDAVLADDSPDAIGVAYRGALKRHARSTTSRVELREQIQVLREDGADAVTQKTAAEREAEAKAKANDRASQAWKREQN